MSALGLNHGVFKRIRGGAGFDLSTFLDESVVSLASVNRLGMRWRVEWSVALRGRRSRFGVPSGAESAEASKRSRLRSSAGRAGGGGIRGSDSIFSFGCAESASYGPAGGGFWFVRTFQEPCLAFPDGFDSVSGRGHCLLPSQPCTRQLPADAVGRHDPGHCPQSVVS
jgi:hypothetical protein